METIKAFFGEYGYSFLMMVVIGFVIAIITEITCMDMSSCLRLCLEYSVHINPGKERIDSPNIDRDQKCRAK